MFLNQDYRDIIALFNYHDVKYLLVGAYAMTFFGYARSTFDIDIWIANDKHNATNCTKALQDFGVPFDISEKDIEKPYSIIQIGVAPNRIDILTDIDGVEFEEAWNKRVTKTSDDFTINILTLEDIIKNKESSKRPKDKLDALELKKLL
ncbi:MAG: hypothetical protein ACLFOC_05740 [Campylobacterales bacterium]